MGGNDMQIVLDISANTHKNDKAYYQRMIDELAKVDTDKHEVIIKGQLFEKEGQNIPQDRELFETMAEWAYDEYGYRTTASVFRRSDLLYLLNNEWPYLFPFVKIANRPRLYWLKDEVPKGTPVYISGINMECVSKYPASIDDYTGAKLMSDHTVGLDLLRKFKPDVWEKHYKLSDSTGLDAGPWAITPEELREVL
jgi:hypothetical protein